MTRLLAAAAIACLAALPAQATLYNIAGFADGLQETPPVATPGTGTFQATYDDVTNAMSWTFNWSSLIGTSTAAHIHGPAPVGVAAGVIIGLAITLGVTSANDAGALVFPEAHEASLLSGLTYVNLHSSFRPGGEIRGQLLAVAVPEPMTLGIAGLGLGALGLVRRRARYGRAGDSCTTLQRRR